MKRRKYTLIPEVRFVNFKKEFPNAGVGCWQCWFLFERYWSNRIWHINVKHYSLILDFRSNWMLDMMGK